MFVRMVWGKLHAGSWDQYERHYHQNVVGVRMPITGLQERQLLRSTEDPDEGISVSVWESLENLRNYEIGDFRQAVAKEIDHLYRGEYWVKHFEVSFLSVPVAIAEYVRVVSRRLTPGHWDEFERYYRDSYIPGTSETTGLRARQLLRSTEDPDEGVSLSYWDRLEDMLSYERSSSRIALVRGFEELLSPLAYPMGDYSVKHFQIVFSSTG